MADLWEVIRTGESTDDACDWVYQPNVWNTGGSVTCVLCDELIEGYSHPSESTPAEAIQRALGDHLLGAHADALPAWLAESIRTEHSVAAS